MDALYKGTSTQPPASGPKAVAGKTVWYISCGQVAIGCSAPAAAAQEAAKAIGWNFKLYDGAFNQNNKYSTGIEEAVAAKADGIILGGVDCSTVKPALEKAKAAGVKVMAFEAFDCDDPSVGGQALFSAAPQLSASAATWADFIQAWGAAKADWIINKTGGHAKVIDLKHEGHLLGDYLDKGFVAELKKCSGCSIVATVPILDADLTSPGLATKTGSALLSNPDANALQAPYDAFIPLGVQGALKRTNKLGKVAVIAGEGYGPNLDAIRAGQGQDAAAAWSVQWAEWALVDSLNRLFANKQPAPAGLGFTLIDKDHNLPATKGTGFDPGVDFRAQYKKVWGVG